jgi:hypothetical protein
MARFQLSEEQARAVAVAQAEGRELDTPLSLGPSNLAARPDIGCWECEQVLSLRLIGTDCPGDPNL